MPEPGPQQEEPGPLNQLLFSLEPLALLVTVDVQAGVIQFEWSDSDSELVAKGTLAPAPIEMSGFEVLHWAAEHRGGKESDGCKAAAASTRALLGRIRKRFPIAEHSVKIGLVSHADMGEVLAGQWFPFRIGREGPWKWLGGEVQQFARLLESTFDHVPDPVARGRLALYWRACSLLGIAPSPEELAISKEGRRLLDLRVTFNQVQGIAELEWRDPQTRAVVAHGRIHYSGYEQLSWDLNVEGSQEREISSPERDSIRGPLGHWLKRFPTNQRTFAGFWIQRRPGYRDPVVEAESPFAADESPYPWIEDNIVAMAEALRLGPLGSLGSIMDEVGWPESLTEFERYQRRLVRKEQKRAEEEARRHETMQRLAEERRLREERREEERKARSNKTVEMAGQTKAGVPIPRPGAREHPALPPVPVHFEAPPLEFQETAFPLADLRNYSLRERAALWWISNQSDDLLCLPHCQIERLEYQLRTALRVLGPLRGRALLSDEVGLGKTIEAGLVIKELLTRGMVKRFLVLTVPSLVDQWEEELASKFGLAAVTTNHAVARGDLQQFWRENPAIVASLHTLKQPAQLEIARNVQWDILIVDEAHYLRSRESQAWQAVNALSRQFLLLLTATPVQNSLEELYNLVTLLQPGQLPSPKEFRARFLDPKRPRQPREPEELRRLLGQVMIRNTRANTGIQLPPRRAETVLFEPDPAERTFWQKWETEFRASLARLAGSQSSLWGRLLLQAAGSSPAAWGASMAKFPDPVVADAWRRESPPATGWQRKCQLIVPLTRGEGGAVIFTQFLETQAALAEFLREARVETFAINGATPAVERQPITEEFRQRGGALLLTHSGTEGRNLQFCHRLVNFDLPWNPMEIEQRIGRLHRLGQQQPVHIYNFVQAGTLQEHLLQILQEKLNLFELVVGETGMVLGDRFSSDEFAEEVLRRWRQSDGRVAEALASLGEELAAARDHYGEIKKLDETLFAKDYESL